MKRYIVGVIGSREWSDKKTVNFLLDKNIYYISRIVSGGAKGPDSYGEKWARKNNIDVSIHYPPKNRKRPFHYRNRLIAEESEIILAFQLGKSSGTQYTIDYMKSLNKPVFVFHTAKQIIGFNLLKEINDR